jgi:hypothetical protein
MNHILYQDLLKLNAGLWKVRAARVPTYRGYGSGILRALENYPCIDFIDDRDGNLFKCIIERQGY